VNQIAESPRAAVLGDGFSITVWGEPRSGGKAGSVWQARLDAALRPIAEQIREPIGGAVRVQLTFVMPRSLRTPLLQMWHTSRPGVLPMTQVVLDALRRHGLIPDDEHVCELVLCKPYGEMDEPPHLTAYVMRRDGGES